MREQPDSSGSSPSLPQDHYIREQVHLLYSGLPLSLISSLIIGLLLSISHLAVIGQAEIIYWNIIFGAMLIARLILWQFWLNTGALYSPKFWLQLFRLGAWLGGIAWGAAPLLIYSEDNPIYQSLLCFSLAGVVSGSLTSLSADRPSALGFAVLAVFPLTGLLILSQSPVAIGMSIMTLLFVVFVVSSSGRTQKELKSQLQQNELLRKIRTELEDNQKIENIVNKIQSRFISGNNYLDSLKQLIDETTQSCHCDLGFIAEVIKEDNQSFMRMLTYSYKKNSSTYDFFSQAKNNTPQDFKNLNGLFGKLISTQKPVFSGNPRLDIRSIGTPDNHPEIHNFVGIPIFQANQVIAAIGLANCTQELTPQIVERLVPITNLIAQLIGATHLHQQHKQDIEVLEEVNLQSKTILDDIADGIVTIDKYGNIRSFNKAAETIFGYTADNIIGKSLDLLMPDTHKKDHQHKISEYLKTGNAKIIGFGREVTGVRRNGKLFPMDLMVSKVTQKGEPLFIGIIRDISEKESLQQQHITVLKRFARDIRIPTHTISQSLDLIDLDNQDTANSNNLSLLDLANLELDKIHRKIDNLLLNRDDLNSKIDVNPKTIVTEYINNYRHIASLKNSKITLIADANDYNVSIKDLYFEEVMIFFLETAVSINQSNSDIKIFIEPYKGKIRVYLIAKDIDKLEILKNEKKWNDHVDYALLTSSVFGTEKMQLPTSTEAVDVIYVDLLMTSLQ